MKTKLQLLILSAFIALGVKQSNAQSTLIQFWDFNQIRPIAGGGGDSLGTVYSYAHTAAQDTPMATWPLTANYTANGLTAGHILYSRPTYRYANAANNNGRDSILDGVGPGGSPIYDYSSSHYTFFNHSDSGFAEGNGYIKARNPSDSCYFYLYMPTTGYKNISLKYVISQSSLKGATYNIFSYSTDGGTTWKNLTRAMDTFNIGGHFYPDTLQMSNHVTDSSVNWWYPVQINFTSDANVNNNPTGFILRFRLAGLLGGGSGNSVGGSGNDRYDNFSLWGTSTTAGINELTAANAGYGIYPNPTNNVLNVVCNNYTGDKLVSIHNILGQQIGSNEKVTGERFSLNVAGLTSGVYFISVNELETGTNYTLKFVKN